MRKNFLLVLLALCMVLTMLPGFTFAEEIDVEETLEITEEPKQEMVDEGKEPATLSDTNALVEGTSAPTSGTCGKNVDWRLDDANGILTISGTGAMRNYSWAHPDTPWYSQRDAITAVVISEGVTTIGGCAFTDCSNLSSVAISNSVGIIGGYAFENCINLHSVFIPDSVTQIRGSAFYRCRGLNRVTMGNHVTYIGNDAFNGCISLSNIALSESVTHIGDFAFNNCSSLRSLGLPEGITKISFKEFSGCRNLASITIPAGVTCIGIEAFEYCTNLTSITIQENVTQIEQSAFLGCSSLKDVYYSGSEVDWAKISIDFNNSCLKNAVIHYNSGGSSDLGSNAFVMGRDQWRFSNSGDFFTDKNYVDDHATETYFLNDRDYYTLTKNLNTMEKSLVDNVLNMYWNGSCYGMSATAILAKAGIITPNSIQNGTKRLHDIQKANNDSVESFINFYFLQQLLTPSVNHRNNFATKSTVVQLQEIEKKAGAVSTTGVPVLIAFSGSGGGHAVVAYGVEHGKFLHLLGPSSNGGIYDSRIQIYDCNYPEGSTDSYIWYNSGTDEWFIPNYLWADKLTMACDDISILDGINYYRTANRSNTHTAWLDFKSTKNGYFLDWGGSKRFIDSATDFREEGIITYYDACVTADGVGHPETLHLTLPSSIDSYSVEPLEGGDSDFTLYYENSALSMDCESADRITFSPEGKVEATDVSGDYSVGLIFNDGYHSLPWHETSISGTDGGNVSVEQTKDGIVIEGDNLNDIIVTVENEDKTQDLRFTTDEGSVLLTEEASADGTKPIIMADSNGDGIYDEKVESYTITFNPNGGSVSSKSMTTDTEGRLSYLPTPARAGYLFAGWYTASEGGVRVNESHIYTADTTLYARWTPLHGRVIISATFAEDDSSGTAYTIGGETVTLRAYPDDLADLIGGITREDGGWSIAINPGVPYIPNSTWHAPESSSQPAVPAGIEAADTNLKNFKKVNTYRSGMFTDVADTDWFAKNVKAVYEYGLMSGSGEKFNPRSNVTLAQCLAIACRLHSIYETGEAGFKQSGTPWYQVYLDYARRNGLSGVETDRDYNVLATRRDVAKLLHWAMPDSLTAKNYVTDGAVPDIAAGADGYQEIYALYRAGVVGGSGENMRSALTRRSAARKSPPWRPGWPIPLCVWI